MEERAISENNEANKKVTNAHAIIAPNNGAASSPFDAGWGAITSNQRLDGLEKKEALDKYRTKGGKRDVPRTC